MANPAVYIAGVGATISNDGSSSSELIVSAVTKALLDAGTTYSDIDSTITGTLADSGLKVPKPSLDTFGKTGAPVSEVECYAALHTASQFLKSGHSNCVLLVGFDKEASNGASGTPRVAVIALVLVSRRFLRSHAYLKDSSAYISGSHVASPVYSRASRKPDSALATKRAISAALEQSKLGVEDIQIVELHLGSHLGALEALGELKVSEDNSASPVSHPFVGSTGLAGLCELVWQLRGWAVGRSVPGARNCLQFTIGPEGSAYVTILCRADGQTVPRFEMIKHLRDGRERLGYNPAKESRDISVEDWHAVKARDNFVPESTRKRLKLPVRGGDRAALARL